MSWSIDAKGTKQDILKQLDTDAQRDHIPVQAREAIRNLVNAVGNNKNSTFSTYGHINPDGSGNVTVKIDPVTE